MIVMEFIKSREYMIRFSLLAVFIAICFADTLDVYINFGIAYFLSLIGFIIDLWLDNDID